MSPIIVITGPTAAGKTDLALALADRFPVRLINVDSAQVYRGLDIGSAKLSEATQAQYPHALIDIKDPEETYSAAAFLADADHHIAQALDQGLWPVLVGGTPLYLRAVLYGLDPLPKADANVRAAIAEEAKRLGWAGLHARLMAIDPALEKRIVPSDKQRIQRALEIHALTGQRPSSLMQGNRIPRYRSCRVVVTPAHRQCLHERIAQRFDAMLDQGLIDEVDGLMARSGLTGEHASMKSVGYRQVWQWLASGQGSLAEVKGQAVAATRQLAKRQLTALRKLSHALWYDSTCGSLADNVARQVAQFLARQQTTSKP